MWTSKIQMLELENEQLDLTCLHLNSESGMGGDATVMFFFFSFFVLSPLYFFSLGVRHAFYFCWSWRLVVLENWKKERVIVVQFAPLLVPFDFFFRSQILSFFFLSFSFFKLKLYKFDFFFIKIEACTNLNGFL